MLVFRSGELREQTVPLVLWMTMASFTPARGLHIRKDSRADQLGSPAGAGVLDAYRARSGNLSDTAGRASSAFGGPAPKPVRFLPFPATPAGVRGEADEVGYIAVVTLAGRPEACTQHAAMGSLQGSLSSICGIAR
ncbi:hypothetical protein BV20DRAFT_1054994 [Pilatotrama ljubarskyi]|nr:hypothetical protein BV20DRAFT_1054994 [Pilatotrama ljubarskyi]